MKSLNKNRKSTGWLSKISSTEIVLITVSALLINFYAEKTLWQALACAAIGTVVFWLTSQQQGAINRKINALISRQGVLPVLGVVFFFVLAGCAVLSPDPAHAILFKAEAAVVKGIEDNVGVDGGEVAKLMVGFVKTVLWIVRAGLLGILAWMAVKANEEREQDEAFIKFMRRPAMFVFSVLVINQIATYIAVAPGA